MHRNGMRLVKFETLGVCLLLIVVLLGSLGQAAKVERVDNSDLTSSPFLNIEYNAQPTVALLPSMASKARVEQEKETIGELPTHYLHLVRDALESIREYQANIKGLNKKMSIGRRSIRELKESLRPYHNLKREAASSLADSHAQLEEVERELKELSKDSLGPFPFAKQDPLKTGGFFSFSDNDSEESKGSSESKDSGNESASWDSAEQHLESSQSERGALKKQQRELMLVVEAWRKKLTDTTGQMSAIEQEIKQLHCQIQDWAEEMRHVTESRNAHLMGRLSQIPFTPSDAYTNVEAISDGAFAEVFRASSPSGLPVALKVFSLPESDDLDQASDFNSFIRELSMYVYMMLDPHAEASRRYVIQLRSLAMGPLHTSKRKAAKETRVPIMVFTAMERDLQSFVLEYGREGPLPEAFVAQVISFIAHYLAYNARLSIVHADLKLSNILITFRSFKDFDLRMCDLGLSFLQEDLAHHYDPQMGHYLYRAPEVYMMGQVSELVDVYAMAQLMPLMWGERLALKRNQEEAIYSKAFHAGGIGDKEVAFFFRTMCKRFGALGWLTMLKEWQDRDAFLLWSTFAGAQEKIVKYLTQHAPHLVEMPLGSKDTDKSLAVQFFEAAATPHPCSRPCAVDLLSHPYIQVYKYDM